MFKHKIALIKKMFFLNDSTHIFHTTGNFTQQNNFLMNKEKVTTNNSDELNTPEIGLKQVIFLIQRIYLFPKIK